MNPSLALLLFACLVKIAVAESDPEKAWEDFKAKHGKQYSPQGEAVRKSNFFKAHSAIEKHNKGTSTFKCAHNDLSDKSPEELSKLCGLLPTIPKDPNQSRLLKAADDDEEVYFNRQTPPASYDLRTATKCVGPIKNQGQCGSCWSFSAIAPLEYSRCNQTGSYVALSEQMLVDCDTKDVGCNGGYQVFQGAWPWLKTNNKGIQTQASYPYTGVQGTCKYSTSSLGAKALTAYGGPVARDVKSIQNAILTYGVVAAALYVPNENAFYYYSSGVYSTTACSSLAVGRTNHAVALVGWTTVNGVDAWIMRNSWGSSWGTAGYMHIKRGVNMCNIESQVGWAKVSV